jgi:hypothetical protein
MIGDFLHENPDFANINKKFEFGTDGYWSALAKKFKSGRSTKSPVRPLTQRDNIVSIILSEHFGIHKEKVIQVADEHNLSMSAENLVGHLLEVFIASKIEPLGWIWCSGSVVKKIDFIFKSELSTDPWIPLQVKNRDNTENSSSVRVRDGTTIVKWFRMYSRKECFNWDKFPEKRVKLSEEEFELFVIEYFAVTVKQLLE